MSPEESTLLQCELTTVKNLRCGKTGLPHGRHFGFFNGLDLEELEVCLLQPGE